MTTRRRNNSRGGKGGHESRTRIRFREARVVELLLDGRTQHDIAGTLGISQPAVSKIARRVEERLLADVANKVERQRARQTHRLEHIYGEAMRAWQDSKQEGVRRRQRKTEHGTGAGSTVAELVSENRHGDPRFLDEARKALTDLRRVWGVDAPERVSIDAVSVFASMSDEALDLELSRHLRLVQPAPAVVDVTLNPSPSQEDTHGHESDPDIKK